MQVCPRCGNVEQDGAKSCSRCHYTFPQQSSKPAGNNPRQQVNRGQQARPNQRPVQNGAKQVQQRPVQNGARPVQGGVKSNVAPKKVAPQAQGNARTPQANTGANTNPRAVSPQQKKRMQAQANAPVQQAVEPQQNEFMEPAPEFITVKDWLILMIKLIVPIYNIITIVKIWKSSAITPIKSNYIKAYVIYFGITFGVSLVLALILTLLGV